MGSGRPGRRIVIVQSPVLFALAPMPPTVGASYSQLGVPGLPAEQPPVVVSGGGLSAGFVLCGVPQGIERASPQRAGTGGSSPPVYQGSCSSWPYQLVMSSAHAKPCTGQPP